MVILYAKQAPYWVVSNLKMLNNFQKGLVIKCDDNALKMEEN